MSWLIRKGAQVERTFPRKTGNKANPVSESAGLWEEPQGFYPRWGKRTLDIVASAAGLLVSSPILFCCYLLVRLTSRGPGFFLQARLGRYGRPFKVIKFRTMFEGADRLGAAVVVGNDSRLTRVGVFLRNTKLDELPQLINVLIGHMSLVGPRPRVPGEVDLTNPAERSLLTLRPGLTSYATVHHRMEAAFCAEQADPQTVHREVVVPQKSYLDGEYLGNLGFILDLKLLLLTLFLVLMPGKGEPVSFRILGADVQPYSRASQMALDLIVFISAIWLAYWLRFEGNVPEFSRAQRDLLVVLIPMARLGTQRLFGVYDMMWRYINLVDVTVVLASLGTVTATLLLLRLFMPAGADFDPFRIPLAVIAGEYLLAAGGSLALRSLRRWVYEVNYHYRPFLTSRRRHVLVMGASYSGLRTALEISRYPHLQLIGFIDDDPLKRNRKVAGCRVLGTSSNLTELLEKHRITDLLICCQMKEENIEAIRRLCQLLNVKTCRILSIDQILSGEGAGVFASAEPNVKDQAVLS
jgi:lipopolysaccharide/colanic/teichoic acid biosynthesis glycosyltransferase